MENALHDFNHAGAGSVDFMHLMGIVALGDMWLKMATVASAKKGEAFYDNKLIVAAYFFARVTPETASRLAKLQTGAGPIMALAADQF